MTLASRARNGDCRGPESVSAFVGSFEAYRS
jgi:hypothetical protein